MTAAALDLRDRLRGEAAGKTALRLELRLLTCAALIERGVSARFREEFDTSLARFDFMAALHRHGTLTLGEVSRMLLVTNGAVTGLASRLRADGLIEAGEGPADRRTQCVRLSAEGARRFELMAAAHEGWVEALFAGLSPGDKEALLGLLERAKRSLTWGTA
jgi:DNA-binding MarR family transcriptional regulator